MSSPTATSCISGLIPKRRIDGRVWSWPGSSRLVPVIHAFLLQSSQEDADARHKAGHDYLR